MTLRVSCSQCQIAKSDPLSLGYIIPFASVYASLIRVSVSGVRAPMSG